MKTKSQAVIDFIALMTGHVAGTGVSIVFSILTTRFLVPADYGVVASQLFVVSVFGWISDWGLEQALLAWPGKNLEQAAGVHLTLRIISGLMPIVWFFGLFGIGVRGPASYVFAILAMSFFFQKVGMTYKTVIEKLGQLKRLAGLEFFAAVSGVMCAFFMATKGFGALSLASQLLLERFLLMAGYMLACPKNIVPRFDQSIAKNFLTTFGVASSLSATFGLAVYDFMPFLIEKLASAHEAGLYARSFSIATMPLMVTAVFGRISGTVYTQNQFKAESISKWFCSLQLSKAFFIIPAQLFLMVTCHWWNQALFAGRWSGLPKIYVILATYGLVRSFYDDATNLISVGFKNPWEFTFNQAVHAVLVILAGPICVAFGGAAGAGLVMALSMTLVTLRFWLIIFDYLTLSFKTFLLSGLRTLYCGVLEFVRRKPKF